jgi:hypothetical protein
MKPSRNNSRPSRPPLLLWVLTLLSLVTWLARAGAVTLHLKNGDRVTGEIQSEDDKQVTLQSPTLGKLTIAPDQIVRRENVPPTLASPSPVPKPPEPEPKPKPEAKVAPPPPKPKPKRWFFEAQVGANLQYNQQNVEVYYGHVLVKYDHTPFRALAEYHANYGTLNGAMSANNMDGLVRVEYDLSKKVFLFNAATAGYDDIRKIDLQYDDSVGIGYKWITRTNLTLSTDIGVNYSQQYFSDGLDQNFYSGRVGEAFSWKITKRVSFDNRAEILLRDADISNYQFRVEGTLSYLLTDHLTFNITVLDVYDSRPAAGVTPNDMQIRTSLGVKF